MTSIGRWLTWRLLAALSAFVLVCGLGFFLIVRGLLVEEYDAALRDGAEALMALVDQERDGTVDFELPPELAPRYGLSAEPEYFEIWLEDGPSLARSESLGVAHLHAPAGPLESGAVWDLELLDGRAGRAVAVEFTEAWEPDDDDEDEEDAVGAEPPAPVRLLLVHARSREPLDHMLGTMLAALGALGLLIPLGSAVLVRWVVARGLAPLHRISREITKVDPDNLSHRFSRQATPEELLSVVDRLNGLLERLEEAFAREKRFSANVAHELRTPLAELRAVSEVALRGGSNGRAFEDVHDIALQMERIVVTLLALSRAERGEETVRREDLDLVQLLEKSWAPHARRARRRGVACRFQLPPRAPIRSDAALLGAIISNLLENAVVHSPPGGSIECRLSEDHDWVLTIANPAPELERSDLAHLFEPFWQKDSSRSSAERSGLGLATAQAMARLLGIGLSARLPEAGRLEIGLSVKGVPAGGAPLPPVPAADAEGESREFS